MPLACVCFSDDGRALFTGSRADGTDAVWEAGSGRQLDSVRYGGYIEAIWCGPDGATPLVAEAGERDLVARIG